MSKGQKAQKRIRRRFHLQGRTRGAGSREVPPFPPLLLPPRSNMARSRVLGLGRAAKLENGTGVSDVPEYWLRGRLSQPPPSLTHAAAAGSSWRFRTGRWNSPTWRSVEIEGLLADMVRNAVRHLKDLLP